ncbi:hypothetical protein MKEN_00795000 [Mycena kentingensis (nom. inval.)]|nr:hypothetical protein MKEN_00795000 [Mycena kentingensis (nom. inval.)]
MLAACLGLLRTNPGARPIRSGARLSHNPAPARPGPPTVERATTKRALYSNLVAMLYSSKTASLPVLLDYHRLHPDLRSTRSYNFLISLAIRHGSYGTVQSLLRQMATENVPRSFETVRLETRAFIRTGSWEVAWQRVNASYKPLPLPLWLEFLSTANRASRPSSLPRPSQAQRSPQTRFRTLMVNMPDFVPNNDPRSARAVYLLVRQLVAMDRPQAATNVATRYFEALPDRLDWRWVDRCTTILNAVMAHKPSKRRLSEFHAARRKLNSMLAIHADLRPSSKTLVLLFNTLRGARQCGTESWQALQRFKMRWGPQAEDRPVRRRVAEYALIEGRMDIYDKVVAAEQRFLALARQQDAAKPDAELGRDGREPRAKRKVVLIPPLREVFTRQGAENDKWKRLEIRAQKVRLRLSQREEEKHH